MNKVISTENIPIKLWLDDIEDGALEQAKHLANLPFVFHHIAIMPDSHQGYGMPIGGVMATHGEVIPNAVGVDIGCGMVAVKTSLRVEEITTENLKKIMGGSKEYKGGIRGCIPVGFSHQSKKQDTKLMPDGSDYLSDMRDAVIEEEFESALKQIGTLGGGNHFIEIQAGNDGFVYLMIHSGSRNIGFKVAHYYNDLAVKLNEKWCSSIPKNWELAFFPANSDAGNYYLEEMKYCVEFAEASRRLMMTNMQKCVQEVYNDVTFGDMVNIAHNYAQWEHHFGKNVLVYRKGATRAYEGQKGIIPGSQGTSSYLVSGKGNPESFMSCSHGAGRRMGRKEAQRSLNLEEQVKVLNDLGVIHNIRTVKDLDEAPGSYKDIIQVMRNQEDLVNILVELKPLAVIKG